MANKVIRIGTPQSQQENYDSEVYRDISMYSLYKQTTNPDAKYLIDKLVNTRKVYHNNVQISSDIPKNTREFQGAVQNSLKNIFTWVPGERIINPEFGSKLRKLLYEQITSATEELIVAEIKGSVSKWEPRVEIVEIINVSDVNDTEDNTIRLDIKYKINGLETVYTYTYEQEKSE